MKAKIVKMVLEWLKVYQALNDDTSKASSITLLVDNIIKALKSKTSKDKQPKETQYIREYTKDTKKHLKGVKLVISEKNIINQLAFRGIDTKQVIKDLNGSKRYECKANASIYYLKV